MIHNPNIVKHLTSQQPKRSTFPLFTSVKQRTRCIAHATKHPLLTLRAQPMGEVAFLIPEKQNSDGTCFGYRRCFEGQLPLRPKIEKCTYRFGWDFKSMSSESALVAVRFRRS